MEVVGSGVPEVEFADLALGRAQPVEGGADQPAQFGPLGRGTAAVGGQIGRIGKVGKIGRVGGLAEPHLRCAQPGVTFVAGHRVQPGAGMSANSG